MADLANFLEALLEAVSAPEPTKPTDEFEDGYNTALNRLLEIDFQTFGLNADQRSGFDAAVGTYRTYIGHLLGVASQG